MCGIAGKISLHQNPRFEESAQLLSEKIAHRGPDDAGVLTWKNVCLVHRRLAIIDLTPNGHQPMELDHSHVIVFNGEIYNYIEIRETLKQLGHIFHTNSDTEVLLRAWKEWGPASLNKFNGMWAFAILDKLNNKLWLSRDRFGVKPLYYLRQDGELYFASEISPLLAFQSKVDPSKQIVNDFVVQGLADHTAGTFFKDIYQLEASHYLEVDLGTLEQTSTRYYTPTKNRVSPLGPQLEKAVNLRMRSDVKVGTCLSGGLDSSLITKMASRLASEQSPLTAIHATTGLPQSDESSFARMVADTKNVALTIIQPTLDDYEAALDDVIKIQQEPFGSPSIIMQYFVMKKAKELGCKVMLDGQAADEVFLGYPSYNGVLTALSLFEGKLVLFSRLFAKFNRSMLSYIYKVVFGKSLAIRSRKLTGRIRTPLATSLFKFQIREIYSRHLPALLRYEDRNSMFHGVEARLPYMDFNVVEVGLGLPLERKFTPAWQKYELRKLASGYLPQEICWRKDKMGFVSPQDELMEKIDTTIIEAVAGSKLLNQMYDLRNLESLSNDIKWRLFCVARWEQIFLC